MSIQTFPSNFFRPECHPNQKLASQLEKFIKTTEKSNPSDETIDALAKTILDSIPKEPEKQEQLILALADELNAVGKKKPGTAFRALKHLVPLISNHPSKISMECATALETLENAVWNNRNLPQTSLFRTSDYLDPVSIILSKLTTKEVRNLASVSKSVRSMVKKAPIERLNTGEIPFPKMNYVEVMRSFKGEEREQLKTLKITSKLTDGLLKKLSRNFPNLNYLSINSDKITDDGLESLKKFTLLRGLSLMNSENSKENIKENSEENSKENIKKTITGAGLVRISELTNLESLELYGYEDITDEELKNLSTLKNLNSLYLSRCTKITRDGLNTLTEAYGQKLQNLAIDIPIKDDFLQKLADDCPNLISLSIRTNKVTDEGMKILPSFTRLKTLQLSDLWIRSTEGGANNITDIGLKEISKIQGLESLSLIGFHLITDEGLAPLSELNCLESLCITNLEGITDEGLARIADIPRLKDLEICSCNKLTSEGLINLKLLASLRSLYLARLKLFDNEALSYLSQIQPHLPNLKILKIGDIGKIDNAGLPDLYAFTHLDCLDLSECPLVKDNGIEALKKNLPSVKVIEKRSYSKLVDDYTKRLQGSNIKAPGANQS